MVGGRGWGGGDPGVSLLSRASLVEVGLCAGAAKCSWLQMAYPCVTGNAAIKRVPEIITGRCHG